MIKADPSTFLAPARKKTEVELPEQSEAAEVETVGYTSSANPNLPCPTCKVESDECYAKKVVLANRTKYYVKIGTSGYMYDPWNSFNEGMQNRAARLHGKKAWEFREVSEASFEFYIKFLRTRNKTYKLHAERNLSNG